MKSYVEASRFPLTEINGITVPRLILGHLPFIGESYQGPEKNRTYVNKFSNVENTIKILTKAVNEYGVTVAAASPANEGELAELFLRAVKETIHRTGIEIALIPCLRIPLMVGEEPIDDYRRWLTYYKIERLLAGDDILKKYLEDPILQCREGWREKFQHALAHSLPYEKGEQEKMRINYEKLKQAVASLREFRVLFVEPGSETDFLAMIERTDLLSELMDWLRGNFNYPVLLGSHHAGITIPILEMAGINFAGYITPINKAGVMMFPTQEIALEAIRGVKKPVIAIKTLAGGRIPPREALEWINKKTKIAAYMIGVGSESEADKDLSIALEILSATPGREF
ncbi:MAG: hypothetical protein QW231_04280 [Candidatus Bathyarchaeia archaeon]